MAAQDSVSSEATPGTARFRYDQLDIDREVFLERARSVARLTIPHLYPEKGHTSAKSFQVPYQGVGARGVNNLASKLLLALFPPNSPPFKLEIESRLQREEPPESDTLTKIKEQLSDIEQGVVTDLEAEGVRNPLYQAFRLLLVGGNALLHMPNEGGMRTFHLENYVVKRDPMGQPFEIVVKEKVAWELVPEAVRPERDEADVSQVNQTKTLDIFTWIKFEKAKTKRGKGKWIVHQETGKGVVLPDSMGTFPGDAPPWIALTWTRIAGEDYGRGLGEEQFGDLRSLELLASAIVKGSLAAAKVIFLVNPAGVTDVDDIAEQQTATVTQGRADDVTTVQVNKFADFSVARNMAESLEMRLQRVFLLNSSVQRAGERVTAEEIRFVARELEDTLGGIFSLFSKELQEPVILRTMNRMRRRREIGVLPKEIRLIIITGLDALRRSQEIEKMQTFTDMGVAAFGPDGFKEIVERINYMERIATGLALDTKGLLLTREQLQQQQAAEQIQGAIGQLGPEAIKSVNSQILQENELTAGAVEQEEG